MRLWRVKTTKLHQITTRTWPLAHWSILSNVQSTSTTVNSFLLTYGTRLEASNRVLVTLLPNSGVKNYS